MSKPEQMLFARNLICVCIEDGKDADYQGHLYHQYSDEPIEFDGVADMTLKMDELYDEWEFPQNSLAHRSFDKRADIGYEKSKAKDTRLPIEIISEQNGVRNVQNRRGRLGTFIVQVAYRQDATWQGHVIHKENNEKRDFISSLELIRYIDESLAGE